MRTLASPKTGPRRKPRLAFIPVLTLFLAAAVGHAAEVKQRFDIDAGNAAPQINEFGLQANLQLLGDFKLMSRVTTHAVHGEFTPKEALDKMLAGTGLRYRFIDEETLNILGKDAVPASVDTNRPANISAPRPMAEVTVTGTHIRGESPIGGQRITISREDIDRSGLATLADVLRTLPQNFNGGPTEDTRQIGRETRTNSGNMGTAMNLRGMGPGETLVLIEGRRLAPGGTEGAFLDISSIPLTAVDHIDILPDSGSALYGADAIGGVINVVLRHDYSGVESRARAGAATAGQPGEYQFGQLFGMQRANGSGLLTLEYYRREALPTADRAQAHSDLRRFGGGNFDTQRSNPGTIIAGGQTFAIPSGQDGTALTVQDFVGGTRNLEDLYQNADLVPLQRRGSIVGTVQAHPTENVRLFADALFSRRQPEQKSPGFRLDLPVTPLNPFYVNPTGGNDPIFVAYNFNDDLGPLTTAIDADTFNIAMGASFEARWRLSTYAAYADENMRVRQTGTPNVATLSTALMNPEPNFAFNPFGDGSHTSPAVLASIRSDSRFSSDSRVTSFNVTADGPLVSGPTGEVQFALGAEYRHQNFRSAFRGANVGFLPDTFLSRTVKALFGEVLIPLARPEDRRRGLHDLQLSIAVRREDYTDVTGTTAPKFGLRWKVAPDMTLRATWTRSFRAPNLADLSEVDNNSAPTFLFDPQLPGGMTQVLVWNGKNRDLRSEVANGWTIGAELSPPWLGGWSLATTYFDVRLRNRFIETVVEPESFRNILGDPKFAYLITLHPSAEQQKIVCDRSQFLGVGNCRDAVIDAIVDLRLSNSAFMATNGLDLSGRRAFDTSFGRFEIDLNGTYVFRYVERIRPQSELRELIDTQNNPLQLRMRGSLTWRRAGLSAVAIVNHDGAYRDVASEPHRTVGSWTTWDMQLRYDIEHRRPAWLADTRFSLNAQNLFDRTPPFLNNPLGLAYDAENADLLGRVVSLEIRRKW